MWSDLRYALRSLRTSPGFTAVVVLTLALGIGATTAMFSILNGILLKPLPYPFAERLVRVFPTTPDDPDPPFKVVSYPNFLDLATATRSFETVGLYTYGSLTLTGRGDPTQLRVARATPGLLDLLGARPAAGRLFGPEEEGPGAPPVVVLGWELWQGRFGGDASAIGRTAILDGNAYTIVGVARPGFRLPSDLAAGELTDAIVPVAPYAAPFGRGIHRFAMYARLHHGATGAAAREELAAIGRRLAEQHPETNADQGFGLVDARDLMVRDSRRLLVLLAAAVGFVLLIACANVANLLLARGTGRSHEIAVRAALGASRGRLLTWLAAESAVLACVGGALGWWLADWGTGVLRIVAATRVPRLQAVELDGAVLAFAAALCLAAVLLSGLLPAWFMVRSAPVRPITGASGRVTAAGSTARVRSGLAAAQVALAVPLLAGASLLLNSFWRLSRVEPGLEADRAVVATLSLPASRYRTETEVAAFYRELMGTLRAISGVEAAGATTSLPLSGAFSCDTFATEDRPGDEQPCAEYRVSTPGYGEALGIALLRGRRFTDADRAGAPPVALVSQALANRLWPGGDPIGRRIKYGGPTSRGPWHTVVGVVGDVRHKGLGEPIEGEFHVPHAQVPWPRSLTVVIRSVSDPTAIIPALRRAVGTLDPELPVTGARSMRAVIGASVAAPRFRTTLFGAFAAFALGLAVLGVFALMAHVVSERTRELGIRMALGADRLAVRTLVLGQAGRLVCAGLLVGLPVSLITGRLMSGFLFGVRPTDPASMMVVVVVLVVAALVGSYVPARRAMRVDPMVALRQE